mmetsp:Transcript_18035/g.45119  ORF Transcript_18035/g.45119 Transcript_18035/m.45119 type:complete len:165 (-) Transcript_18035:456-950(-)|eukprot:CAMPEP_0179000882 /NCGR_PEP_ID=MMETSP0795-20121207/10971_1 /TAXON_ID=88552 /ORGANISM="Amoebophrya sp., Strain Ameob2" /LENGTH=164 /DNA_ID=CAMNT_0020694033 /DNA_START=179 /DNA_END=673 /DNA_ORIENTATION=+
MGQQKQTNAKSKMKKHDILAPVELDNEKVYTCRKIVKVGGAGGGTLLAVPFKCPTFHVPKPKFDDRTTHNGVYNAANVTRTSAGAGTANKPLSLYNPNAPRSLLKQDPPKIQSRSDSSLRFDQPAQRPFVSVSQNEYRGHMGQQSANPGITSEKVKEYHRLQQL